jgi:hypothetical protein
MVDQSQAANSKKNNPHGEHYIDARHVHGPKLRFRALTLHLP